MIPKIHPKGSSFKGAAAYLLHDKDGASTAERLAWVETRNLATDDPELAWRIMAATAMDQDRLKQEAGIKSTGRKSKASVLHFSLSWHEEEAEELTREEMLRAAAGALRALGAEDRQSMIISHNDEPHPHLHVLLNRVSQEDGRLLSSSREKLELSKWAQAYEEDRGKIYCEDRVLNNAARARGEFTRAAKDKPRNIYEAEVPANDNSERAAAIQAEQRRKAAELSAQARDMRARHQSLLESLAADHRERVAQIRQDARRQATIVRDHIRQQHRPAWESLFETNRDELAAFEGREERLVGRVQNALNALDFRALMAGEDRRRAISDAFAVFSSAGARLDALRRDQDERSRELLARQREAEAEGARMERERRDSELARNRERFLQERNDAQLKRRMDEAALRALWRERAKERQEAWARFEQERAQAPSVEAARRPSLPEPDRQESVAGSGRETRAARDGGASEQDRFADFLNRHTLDSEEQEREH